MMSRDAFGAPLIVSPDPPSMEVEVVHRGRFIFVSAGVQSDDDRMPSADSAEYRAARAAFER